MLRTIPYDPRVRIRDTVRAPDIIKNYLLPTVQQPRVVRSAGSCPRCEHETHNDFPLRIVGPREAKLYEGLVQALPDLDQALDADLTKGEFEFDQRCNCRVQHPKTPKERTGCGAAFRVRVKWPKQGASDNEIITSRAKEAPTPDELDAEEAWEKVSEGQLENVRKAAENWRNGLAALIALVGTIFFVKGRESVFDIDETGRQLLALALVVALSVAVWGAWQAMRASFGQYGVIDWADVEEQGGWSGYQASLAEGAAVRVRQAQGATLVTLAALVLAVLITWFAPKPPSTTTTLSVVRSGETVAVCGEFTGVSGGRVNITDAEPIPVSEIVSFSVVDRCGST